MHMIIYLLSYRQTLSPTQWHFGEKTKTQDAATIFRFEASRYCCWLSRHSYFATDQISTQRLSSPFAIMRHLISALLLSCGALESSHSWQTQVPLVQRRRHFSSSSSTITSTRLQISSETLEPALAIMVGAAGTLLLKIFVDETMKTLLAENETTQKVESVHDEATELEQAETKEVLREGATYAEEVQESTNPTSVESKSKISSNDNVVVVAKQSDSDSPEKSSGGDPTRLDSTVASNNDETPSSLKKNVTNMDAVKEGASETVEFIDKVAVDVDKSRPGVGLKPSFLSYLEASQKTAKAAAPIDKPVMKEQAPNVDAGPKKDPVPSFIAQLDSTSKSVTGALRKEAPAAQKKGTNELGVASTTESESAVPMEELAVKGEMTNVNADTKKDPEPSFLAQVDSPSKAVADAMPKEESASEKTGTMKAPPQTLGVASTKRIEEKVPSSQTKSFPKETAQNISTPVSPAKDAPPFDKVASRSTTPAANKQSASSRPRSADDIMKSITMPPKSKNGITQKQRIQPTAADFLRDTAVAKYRQTKPTTQSSSKESLKTSLSILTSGSPTIEKGEFDDETATDSLRQYIQDKARDMTRKRMDDKHGIKSTKTKTGQTVQPLRVKDETTVTKMQRTKKVENVDNLPVFYAPVVDDPFETTKPASTASTDSDEQVAPTDADKQVAKSLKKKSGSKKAQKSVLLVAVAAGVVVIGKCLVSIAIGRGMI